LATIRFPSQHTPHHLSHAFVEVPARHLLRLAPHTVAYDAHVGTVSDALVSLEGLVGEVPEKARFPRAPLSYEHQFRPGDSLRPLKHRLVVRANNSAHRVVHQRVTVGIIWIIFTTTGHQVFLLALHTFVILRHFLALAAGHRPQDDK
jgi:hypothetical protein